MTKHTNSTNRAIYFADEMVEYISKQFRVKIKHFVPDMERIKKVALAEQKKFHAKNPKAKVPPQHGTDTLRLISAINSLQNWFSKP